MAPVSALVMAVSCVVDGAEIRLYLRKGSTYISVSVKFCREGVQDECRGGVSAECAGSGLSVTGGVEAFDQPMGIMEEIDPPRPSSFLLCWSFPQNLHGSLTVLKFMHQILTLFDEPLFGQ